MTNTENVNVMYFHGTTCDGYRFTIAGMIDDDDLLLSVAICGDGDCFSKAKGRIISTGRLFNQRQFARGRVRESLYSNKSRLKNEFGSEFGFPENYFRGKETKVFRQFVWNYTFYTKKELCREFSMHK